ncbi:ubiquitin-conjugating enzyme E2-binding protein [Aspergillus heterothallicus]
MSPSKSRHEFPKSQAQPFLSLHAEYLPNIRQVSLQIAIAAAHAGANSGPEISLNESRKAVIVSLPGSEAAADGLSEMMKLPVRVGEGARRMLNVRTNGSMAANSKADEFHNKAADFPREYSYRMPVDNEDVQRSALEEVMDAFVPWAAGDMDPFTKLRCRGCQRVVLDTPEPNAAVTSPQSDGIPESQSVGWKWKDLPSGNWAEMMDFWHCHKPDEHENDEDAAAHQSAEDENSKVKGYGASNQLLAVPGTVLIDVATFLVSDRDCKGLEKVSSGHPKQSGKSRSPEENLLCKGCGKLIGVEDIIAKGWRLFKNTLSAGFPTKQSLSETKWETHPTDLVVAAQLLELIERESARRFIIHCGNKDGLLIWVFNPDMRYSSSGAEYIINSQRAMKVFFQKTDNVDELLHPETGKPSSLSLEELRLPSDTFTAFFHALDQSNKRLPSSARMFQQNWRIGLLHRHERVKPT